MERVDVEPRPCVLRHRGAILSLVQRGEVEKGKMRHWGSMELLRSRERPQDFAAPLSGLIILSLSPASGLMRKMKQTSLGKMSKSI